MARVHGSHLIWAGVGFALNLLLVVPVLTGSGRVSPTVGFPGAEAEGTTGPIIPALVSLVTHLGVPADRAAAVLTALAFAAVAPGLGVLAWYLTRRHLAAWLTLLAASFLPSVVYVARHSVGPITSAPFAAPSAFLATASANTAQVVGLALLPWVAVALLFALKKGGRARILGAGAAGAALLLTGAAATASLALLAAVLVFSEILRSDQSAGSRVARALAVGVLALALAAPWYTVEFWTRFWTLGAGASVVRLNLGVLPYAIVAAPWLLIGLFYLFGFRKHAQPLFIAAGWFTAVAAAIGLGLSGGPRVFPFAVRLVPELDMAVALAFGVLGTAFFDWVGRVEGVRHRLTRVFQGSLLAGVSLSVIGYTAGYWRGAWAFLNSLPPDATAPAVWDTGQPLFQRALGITVALVAVALVFLTRTSDTVQPLNPPRA
jgi:hypothetical protein